MYFRAEPDNNTDPPKKNSQKELMGGKEKRQKARLGALKGGERKKDWMRERRFKANVI